MGSSHCAFSLVLVDELLPKCLVRVVSGLDRTPIYVDHDAPGLRRLRTGQQGERVRRLIKTHPAGDRRLEVDPTRRYQTERLILMMAGLHAKYGDFPADQVPPAYGQR